MLVVHFALSYSVDDGIGIYSQNSTNANWLLVETSGQVHDFGDALHLEVIVELGPELLECLSKVNLVRMDVLEEEVTALGLVKDFVDRPVEQFFDEVQSGFRSLLEELLVNSPEPELYLKHLRILFLLFV